MSKTLRPYPQYRPSGISWLGDIPSHWTHTRADTILHKTNVVVEPKHMANDTVFHYSIPVIEDTGDGQLESISDIDSSKLLLKGGEIIISKLNPRKSRVVITEAKSVPIICSTEFVAMQPRHCSVRYVFYLFSSENIRQYLSSRVESVTRSHQRVNPSVISKISLCIPTIDEQEAIAAYLDRETRKIDELISRKERFITLLVEKRSTLISHAMTRGLNPDAPMKDSGIEWLGDVPAHWAVAPVYSRYKVQLGKMLDSNRITGQQLSPYLRNVDVQWNAINIENLPQMDFDEDDKKRFALRPGDLLVCEGGEVGRAAIWSGLLAECYYQKALHRLRATSQNDLPRFMYYLLYNAARQGVFVAQGNPNTIDHLTAEKLRAQRFGFPPIEEQKRISAFLDVEMSKIDRLTDKTRQHIARLQERRVALISAAVTGKIDVRPTVGSQPESE